MSGESVMKLESVNRDDPTRHIGARTISRMAYFLYLRKWLLGLTSQTDIDTTRHSRAQ
jgi:hypothetical protein